MTDEQMKVAVTQRISEVYNRIVENYQRAIRMLVNQSTPTDLYEGLTQTIANAFASRPPWDDVVDGYKPSLVYEDGKPWVVIIHVESNTIAFRRRVASVCRL